ncbi:hypothetical protein [uncultured Agrococcus sp.]|uniref:hypothetical protein n=1 Tax=uncultured Agrococcus sp. TaxID=382258 RepID=UPI0025F38D0E|nr:hypothetical protein [uncultured Agrococcus sp.]
MDEFKIGDTVQIKEGARIGSVGTVVYLDEPRNLYLVRVGADYQNYFAADGIELFRP